MVRPAPVGPAGEFVGPAVQGQGALRLQGPADAGHSREDMRSGKAGPVQADPEARRRGGQGHHGLAGMDVALDMMGQPFAELLKAVYPAVKAAAHVELYKRATSLGGVSLTEGSRRWHASGNRRAHDAQPAHRGSRCGERGAVRVTGDAEPPQVAEIREVAPPAPTGTAGTDAPQRYRLVSQLLTDESLTRVDLGVLRGRVDAFRTIIEEPVGGGHLVAFANEPMFRAWWRALDRLVLNAIVLGPAY